MCAAKAERGFDIWKFFPSFGKQMRNAYQLPYFIFTIAISRLSLCETRILSFTRHLIYAFATFFVRLHATQNLCVCVTFRETNPENIRKIRNNYRKHMRSHVKYVQSLSYDIKTNCQRTL